MYEFQKTVCPAGERQLRSYLLLYAYDQYAAVTEGECIFPSLPLRRNACMNQNRGRGLYAGRQAVLRIACRVPLLLGATNEIAHGDDAVSFALRNCRRRLAATRKVTEI